jgi:hypothetical protein
VVLVLIELDEQKLVDVERGLWPRLPGAVSGSVPLGAVALLEFAADPRLDSFALRAGFPLGDMRIVAARIEVGQSGVRVAGAPHALKAEPLPRTAKIETVCC